MPHPQRRGELLAQHLRQMKLRRRELTAVRRVGYCYDAGNVNMYQAAQLSRYYGVKTLPAVIVDGRLLQDDPDADDILSALK